MKKNLAAIFICILLSLLVCNPALSKDELDDILYGALELYLGTPTYNYLYNNIGFVDNKEANDELVKMATRLNQQSKNNRAKSINILNTSEINAIAIPGGHIMIYAGLFQMVDSEDEIACVVAHEIGHLEKRHSLKNFLLAFGIDVVTRSIYSRNQQQLQYLQTQYYGFILTRGFSQAEELEADTLALEYVKAAGYNPYSCVTFMTKIMGIESNSKTQYSFMATHPPAAIRIQNMTTWLNANLNSN